jgi:formylglycine-generating enzyme required for sulfatase activity
MSRLWLLFLLFGCAEGESDGVRRLPLTEAAKLVPAGEFVMGVDPGVGHRDERPQHVVKLDAYRIDRLEVTNAEYRACVQFGVCTPPSPRDSLTRQGYFDSAQFDAYPAIHVSWFQARDYCAWKGGRLPTEAEWEKAARGPAPDERTYPWGETPPDCKRANFGGPAGCLGDTDEVGRRPAGASPFGLLDMAGNVWEWTTDWYDSLYYARSPKENPRGPTHGSHKVVRGGCWMSDPDSLRVTCRQAELPSTRAPNVGFRCAY